MMKKLSIKEQKTIKAGASFSAIAAGIFAGVTFLIGILDGYFRPYKCR